MTKSTNRGSGGNPAPSILRLRVRQVCNSAGVSVIHLVAYNNFAARLDKAKRQGVHGEDLCVYARGLVEAYTKKQWLDPKVLVDIAYLVLDVRV